MSKVKKKIICALLLVAIFLSVTTVNAAGKNIGVSDFSVKDKSGTITVEDPVITDNIVTSNITFNEVGDFVTFKLVLKNNENEKYKIESITDNNTNKNLTIDYTFSKGFINTGETSTVEMKLTYKNKLINQDKISLNDLTIKINLVNEDGKSENIIINPTTGDTILHYLVLLILALTGLILSVNKKKIKGMKIGNLIIVLAIILTPFAIFAKEKYEVQIKFNDIDIIGEYETYNITIDPKNGDPSVTKQITYGEKIGALPADPTKDGYTFDKWVDNKGNTVTEDTTITGPISIEAKYNIVKYDITYNLDGGSVSGNPTKYTIEDTITLKNPSKQGYTFAGWTGTGIDTQTTSVTIPVGSTGARNYVAHYSASEDTVYTVIHKFAKLTEGYDIEEVTEHGTTGSTVPAPRKTRTGFVTPSVQNVTIAADGSASVTYTYDRETYAFSITDRTYLDSTSTADGTYPYGTEITLKAQNRPGYTFTWSDGNDNYERTFELEGTTSLTPVYTANTNTKYVVKHYKQKVTQDGYEIADTQNLEGTTDSPITPAVNTYTGFVSPVTQTTTIAGDGSTVVTYNYDRETYSFSVTDRTYLDPTSTADGTYPYGKEITVKAATKPGYTFTKWSNNETSNPYTFTLEGAVSINPVFEANTNTPYTVLHKKQNLDDLTKYTTADTDNLTGTTDTDATPAVRSYTGFTAPSTQTKNIDGNGNTTFEYLYTRNQYTLTITHPEYVVEDKSGSYYYEDTVSLTAIDRPGYTFAGWSTGENTKTITVNIGDSNITVEPLYTSNTDTTYTVIHKYAKLTSGYDTEEVPGTGTTGDTIPAPRQPRTGFVTPAEQNITITADGQASVTYIYERDTYSFSITDRTYLTNSSTANGTYPYETTINLTAVERPGYTFKWSDNVTDYSRSFPLTGNTTNLELIYTANTDTQYTVIHKYAKLTEGYDTEEITGTGTTDDTIPAPRQPRTGFVTPTEQNIKITGDGEAKVTYIYDRETYAFSVTDRTYLVSGSTVNGTYPYGTTINLTAEDRPGYSFEWSDGETAFHRSFLLEAATTLSTVYTANTYTLTAYANNGSIEATTGWTGTGANATKTITYDDTYGTLPTATRTGYTLVGWNTSQDGTRTNITSSTTVSTTTNQEIYAQWIINTYTVTFDTDGGSTVPSQTIAHGGKVTRPATDPEKEGHTFDDWYTTDQYTTKFDFANTTITSATTIYAKFDEINNCKTFSTDSWSTIVSNIESDANYYEVGCEKEIEIDMNNDSNPESYTVRLANTSTPEVCNTDGYSQTACGTVIEFVDIAGTYVWNVANTAAGGWKNSAIASYLNSDFYNKLPSDLKAVMKPTYPIVSGSCNDNNSPDITVEDTNLNKLYLLSAREVGYDLSTDNKKNVLTDTRTLDYYEINSGDKDKQKQLDGTNETWWLRTPTKNALAICNGVYSSGTSVQDYCRKEHGIAPAFRIGTVAPSKYTVSFDTDGGSEVSSQTVSSGGTVTRPATDPEKTGFVFDDWYTTDQYTTKYDFTTPITGDTTIYAKFDEDLCRGFATDTWSTISSNIETNPNYYPLGCTKEVEIDMNDDSTPESYTVRLSNTSTPTVCQTSGYSQTACGTVIEFIDTIESRKMNTSNTNEGGWAGTDMVTYLNSDFYNKLPSDLKSVIIPTYPIVSGGGSTNNSPDITESDTTKNKIYLLSGREVGLELFGDSKKDITTDTRILDYYYENNSDEARIKRNLYTLTQIWWIRTAHSSYENRFYNIDMDGSCNSTAASYTSGVAPVFRIGKNTYTVEFNANGGTVTNPTKEVIKGEEIGTLPTPTPATGKIFDKWYTGIDSGVEVTSTYQVNNNITIYARYTNQEFTVTFDTDGGSEVSSQTVSSGSTATRPGTDPEKTGYVFDDWYTTDQYTTKYDFTTPITGDTTIYAKFDELKTCAENENVTRLSENTCSANENITVGDGIVCKRAVKLHEETCSQTSNYCKASGYTPSGSKGTDTITYGSCGTSGTLASGDAFTCDVNGDGDFDELTERFYYISDYYNTSTKEFDDSTAVLMYYNNVTSGVSCNKNTYAYDSNNDNWKGPRTLTLQLPTTSQWSNVSLKSTSRQILTNLNTTSTSGGALPEFDYSGYAARFITAQELNSACGISIGSLNNGELDSCNYVLENTKYAKAAVGNNGYWLESTYQDDNHVVWRTTTNNRYVFYDDASYAVNSGARPVIEVPKSAIAIGNLPQYTVSFDSDGGSTVADIEVDAGDSINELPTPTKADSVFVGWFESVTDEIPVPTPYTPSGDITLIAKWNNIICKKATTLHTETCNQTDGSKYCSGDGFTNGDTITYGNIVSSDTYEAGDAFDCDVDGTGYNQRFYYLRTNDNKAVLISNKNFTAASKQADQNISFIYSQAHDQLPTTSDWGNLPVKFDGKPARLMTMEDLLTVTNSSSSSDITPIGSLKGYEFLFESSNFSGIGERSTQWLEEISSTERYRYRNDQYNLAKVETGKENTSKNPVRPVIEVPLDLIEDAYIVKFDANGGTSDTYVKVQKGSTIGTLPTATKTDYYLKGWYTSLDYTIPVTENTIPVSFVTYYAKWVLPVTDAQLNTDNFIIQVGETNQIEVSNESDIEQYTFVSNDENIATVDTDGTITAVSTGTTTISMIGSKSGLSKTINVNVQAEVTDYVVSFDSQGGSPVNDMIVPKNTTLGTLPDTPTYEGYDFGGWYTNTNYSTEVTVDTLIISDVTFYALWIPTNAVAEINKTFYTTLQAAVDDAPTTKTTIILLKNVEVTSPIDMANKNTDKDIILDLNGYTLSTGSSAPNKTNVIKTKAKLEVKNGTISSAKNDALIDVEGSTSYLVLREDINLISTGGRACVYNTGGNALIDGNASLTSNAEWTSSMKRGTVQTLTSGVTTIKGGTIINNRASSSYAVAIELGTVTIGTEDGIYDIQNLIMQGETNGIYAAVNYSLYDGMIKGKTAAVNDESKITGIETGATKVNDTDSGYNRLYYTLPVSKYKVTLNANGGEVDPTYINVDAGDQVGTLPTPTRGLYTFDGWWTDYSGGTQVTSSYEPTGNVEIIARWHYNSSTNLVSFNMNNDAIETYANYISSWKDLSQATFQANMMDNMNTNSCSKCDQPNSCNNPTAGTLCDQSVGYNTGVSSDLKVYTSDEITKTKGSLVSYTTSSNGIIYNMIPGETYYWEAADDSTIYGIVKANGYRRLIKSPVRNVRDLGGLAVDTDGDGTSDGRIKYGILFRGAQLSSNQSDATSLQKLGITRELDLRPNSEGKDKGQAVLPKYDIDIPGSEQDVIMHNYLISYSTHPDYYTELRNTIKTVMNYVVEDDDSIFFHCTIGTDRTGTLAYFLEGLLGVSEEDRLEDYELSYYFGMTNRDRYHDNLQNSSINPRFTTMYNTYNTNAKIYEWFMNENPNITQAEKDADEILLSRFRQKMIE